MKREPVTSSVIAAVTYDRADQLLEVEFHTRRLYRYFDVPPNIYDALMRSESIGEYFNRKIRNRYRYEEMTDQPLDR